MTDQELTQWVYNNRDWVDLKCKYFCRNMHDAQDLKAQSYENLWRYRENFDREVTDDNIKSWVFFVIKYAYFHLLQHKYNKPVYHFEHYNHPELITESTILKELQTKQELKDTFDKIRKNLSENHLKVAIDKAEGYSRIESSNNISIKPSLVDKYRKDVINLLKNAPKKEHISKAKPKSGIYSYLGEKIIKHYDSVEQACEELKIGKSVIYRALKEPTRGAGGYHWKKQTIE